MPKNTARVRTGCQTCRARKLKCDEQKPQCRRCIKAGRTCVPGEGVRWRHELNASVNSTRLDGPAGDGSPEESRSLENFYSYRRRFAGDVHWVDIPQNVTFLVTDNPYLEHGWLESQDESVTRHEQANVVGTLHGLEALSAAASADRLVHGPLETSPNTSLADYSPPGLIAQSERHGRRGHGASSDDFGQEFWDFARDDCIDALIKQRQTELDTEDAVLWQEAGLELDERGFVQCFAIQEDMIGNALVWLLGKLVNYCVAADTAPPRAEQETWLGINQVTIHQRWEELRQQFEAWHARLPAAFAPCTGQGPADLAEKLSHNAYEKTWPVKWHGNDAIASTMQLYHMAQMILLANQPQHSTMGRATLYRRLGSYRTTLKAVENHARSICSIALLHTTGHVRMLSVQPLFMAGQVLEGEHERHAVIALLRGIEEETGAKTEYRIRTLFELWASDSQRSADLGIT